MNEVPLLYNAETSDSSCGSQSSFYEDKDEEFEGFAAKPSHNSRFRRCLPTVALACFIVYFFASTFLILKLYQGRSQILDKPYSPATSTVKYKIQKKHATDNLEAFVGPPSNATFDAWAHLVKPSLIRISHEEMVLAGEHPEVSTKVVGGGYMGSLGVYHELHCMRRLKLFLYKDHYYPGLNGSELEYEMNHLDHCLEAIRISLMCAGNSALYTFQWDLGSSRKPVTKTNSERVCVDWEKLETWATERTIGISPLLVGPERTDSEE
ncbi:hypothetical protein HYFRA_00001846 [Hymenoscyphus fraxineus]|uniref:Tat pathway signal sequence n=1 Tax=Hymenoscyphus fraxineus TaxID=746836 RepID=A0A9N9PMA7_9HELO|nr:hypothetical protein HYFRA_00001846 [Hymenoscyphus fraxineus]